MYDMSDVYDHSSSRLHLGHLTFAVAAFVARVPWFTYRCADGRMASFVMSTSAASDGGGVAAGSTSFGTAAWLLYIINQTTLRLPQSGSTSCKICEYHAMAWQ
jgi:hypothetical protein